MPDLTKVLADFGEQGNAAYVSTARREDSIQALREMLRYLESKLSGTS